MPTRKSAKLALSNARIANTVRQRASIDYQSRVPIADQGNIKDVLRSIQSYRPAWNEFIEIFLDECALPLYRVNSWNNALAKFKTARIRNGSWVKEVGYNLVQAHSYDKTATNVFELAEPDVVVNFHLQNRKAKYKITLNDDVLAMAFADEGGLADFASSVMAQVQNSDEIGEYLIMRELFAIFQETNGFFNYQVPDLAASSDIKADAQKITAMLKETNALMKFPNQAVKFNAEHIPYVSSGTVLFATPKFLALNDVYNLAAAFNMERAEFVAGMVQEVDEIPIPGAQAILADRDWFVCTDTLIETASIQNPETLGVNNYLHHWGVYSASRMAPAVLFSTSADSSWEIVTPTATGVTLELPEGVEFAERGKNTQLVAEVQGTNNPDQAVVYTIAGTGGVPLSTNTHISGDGRLWVGTDEQNSYITITAQSIADPTKTASLAVGIGAAYAGPGVTSVTVNGAASVTKGQSSDYTATVAPNTTSQQVIWQVVGGVAGTTISQTGKLTVSADETAANVTVIAISTVDPSKMGTKVVAAAAAE